MDIAVVFTHHALDSCLIADWRTLGGMTVTETVATGDHVIESVIIFFSHLLSIIEQIITESV